MEATSTEVAASGRSSELAAEQRCPGPTTCCSRRPSIGSKAASGLYALFLVIIGAAAGAGLSWIISTELQSVDHSEARQIAALEHMTAYTDAFQRWRSRHFFENLEQQTQQYLRDLREDPLRTAAGSQAIGVGNTIVDAWKDVTDDRDWQDMTSHIVAMSILYPESAIAEEMMSLARSAVFMNHVKSKKMAELSYFETIGQSEARLRIINTPVVDRNLDYNEHGRAVDSEKNRITQSLFRLKVLQDREREYESKLVEFHKHLVQTVWPN